MGPLPFETTRAVGAYAAVGSTVVRPCIEADVLHAVEKEVLAGAIPAADEMLPTLLQEAVELRRL